jgi:hypothetical protein
MGGDCAETLSGLNLITTGDDAADFSVNDEAYISLSLKRRKNGNING